MHIPFFSIILPVYNAKLYIKETIESITNQRFKNFELLLIDDGSTDGSGEIAEKTAMNYSNVMYYRKNNSGICATRNYGLNLAKGKYVLFCDHDDLLQEGILQYVYDKLQNTNVDILKYSYETKVMINNKVAKSYITNCHTLSITREDLRENYFLFNAFINTVWNGAYRRSFLENNNFKFDESIKFGQEDVIFNLNLLSINCDIFMIERIGYLHFIRYGQSTSRKYNINKLFAINKSLQLETGFLSNHNESIDILITGKYIRSYFVSIMGVKNPFQNEDLKKNFEEFQKLLPENCTDRKLLRNFRKHSKDVIKIFLFKHHLYNILFKILKNQ